MTPPTTKSIGGGGPYVVVVNYLTSRRTFSGFFLGISFVLTNMVSTLSRAAHLGIDKKSQTGFFFFFFFSFSFGFVAGLKEIGIAERQ